MSRRPTTGRAERPEGPAARILDVRDQRVLAGSLEDLPKLNSKLVRIFTSSTFTDTQVERNELMEHVYPRIKEYCRQKHGLEFQVVDMRWGVTDEATDDHMTVEVCLNEIKTCQKVSVGPNFVWILGMKYGYQPVPRLIPVEEFNLLRTVISKHKSNGELLTQWYILDTNAQPPVYLLQPISTHYSYFNQKNLKTLYERDQNLWWETLGKLQKMFRDAATKLFHAGSMTPKEYHNYFMSVTEREVTCGVLSADEPSKHCLIYSREITDIRDVPADKARDFIDICYNKVNTELQDLFSNLRGHLQDMIPSKIPLTNYKEYSLQWQGSSGIDPKNDEQHKGYLDDFCTNFESNMMRLIDDAMESQNQREMDVSLMDVYTETLQHLHACSSFTKMFQGRNDILNDVDDYINNQSDVPFVIHGQSGCGKTSIMAKAYSQMLSASPKTNYPVSVIRFLGTSPMSSIIISLLRNISQQIALNYHTPEEDIPTELSLLIRHFNGILELATAEKPLLIFLDSIDQLSTVYDARKLAWIPQKLPPHVKMIISTLPMCKDDRLLETLQKKLSDSRNYVEVKNLGEVLSKDILESWLKSASRTVSIKQQKEINRVLQHCSLPLFLRLVFDQICLWRSFDNLDATQLSTTIHDSIDQLFDRLESTYGKIFVSHTFAYITLSRNGFSETELEDILSLDDFVLNAVYQYHRSPIRRIPPLLWTRLKSEIPNYLIEREADGLTVINWYHRQFFEVAKARYLQNVNVVKKMHSLLSDFFLGTWAGIPKPFRYTEEQRKMFCLSSDEMNGQSDRHVPEQPLIFTKGNNVSYNLRKLGQLPYHLLKSERFRDLEESVLLNYNWLNTKLKARPLQSVLSDFKYILLKQFDPEINIILDSLRLSGSILTRHPDMLGMHLVGRLMPYYSTHGKIQQLINSCDKHGSHMNAVIPAYHCLHTPGGPLQYSLEGHPGAPFGMVVTSNKKYLVSVSRICIIWDIGIGDIWRVVEPQIRGIMQGLCISPDDQYAVCYSNPANQVIVISIMTGEVKIMANPFEENDKIRGIKCNDCAILVWESTKWTVIAYDGSCITRKDVQSDNRTILDMLLTDDLHFPIAKLQSTQGAESKCVLQMTNQEMNDFTYSTSVALNRTQDILYACCVQHTPPRTESISRPRSRYSIVSRCSVVVTQHVRNNQDWACTTELGDTSFSVYNLSFSPDESWLVASIEPGFILWNVLPMTDNSPERVDLDLPFGKKNFPGSKGLCVFSRNNEYFLAGSRKTIFVYDFHRKELLKEITAHFDRILCILSVATEYLNIAITSSSDHSIKIWNFANIRKAVPVNDKHDKEIEGIAVSDEADLAVCVTRDMVGLWDISGGSLLRTLHPSQHNESSVTFFQATNNTKRGQVIRMTHAVLTKDGRFVIGADTQKIIFWESETGDVLHRHVINNDDDHDLQVNQIIMTGTQNRIFIILKSKSKVQPPLVDGMGIVFTNVTWAIEYQFQFQTRLDCLSAVTSNNLYIAVPAYSPKLQADCISVWHVNTGTYLYDISLKQVESDTVNKMMHLKHTPSRVVIVTGTKGLVVEINRKSWKKGNFMMKTILGWTGHVTSDGKFGIRKAQDSKCLEMFEFSSGTCVKTLFAGQHPGDTAGSIYITKNNEHMIYHQPRHRHIQVFRLSADPTCHSKVGLLKPDARITGICDSNNGTDLVVGLSDGRLMVFVIADPDIKENTKRLQVLRTKCRKRTSTMSITSGTEKTSRWAKPLHLARLAAKAKVAHNSDSKVCSIS